MLTRRVIVCLDVDDARVVKGTQFRDLQPHGAPSAMAAVYERDGADEIVFLDITASVSQRSTVLGEVRRTAALLSIPLTVGGGVRSVADMAATLRAGADKVAVNTAAVDNPRLISDAAARFGSQCVVVSIDAARAGSSWNVLTHGARRATALDAVQWASRAVTLGAGELLVTSIDRDGTQRGYDIELTRAIAERVRVPVIASGGAGEPVHLAQALSAGGADAVLVAGLVHRGQQTVTGLKTFLAQAGFPMRLPAQEPVNHA
jgi:cyclase